MIVYKYIYLIFDKNNVKNLYWEKDGIFNNNRRVFGKFNIDVE